MSRKVKAQTRRLAIEPYWILIVPILVILGAVYANHLRIGTTPNRVFFHFAPLDFDIYWYGVCIVGGIALGAFVVSRLVEQRATAIFEARVPKAWRNRSLSRLKLPEEMHRILIKRKLTTLGALMYAWGLDSRGLGLNRKGLDEVRNRLEQEAGTEASWLVDAPWRSWNPDHVWNAIAWCLILGVIGARLYHVLTPSPSMAEVGIESPMDYFRNPYQLINLRNGGLGIYGGIAGGALALFLYARRHRIPFLAWADMAVVGLALGQAFGRWGNFFNQELYGRPTELPWGLKIDPVHLLDGYESSMRFHPAFLYESIWSFLTFVLLLILVRRYASRFWSGDFMALYLILYAVGRILLETVRLDSRPMILGGVTLNMAVATFVSILLAVAMVLWRAAIRLAPQGD